MANAQERLVIFENIIARVGVDGDVLGEYSKAMSALNGLQSYQEMNPPMPSPQMPQQTGGQMPMSGGGNGTPLDPISGQAIDNTIPSMGV